MLDFGYQKMYTSIMAMPLGSHHSIETKKKMSKTQRDIGNRPPSWLGKKHSEATKRKIALNQPPKTKKVIDALIARNKIPWTPEQRKRQSEIIKRRPINYEALKITHQKCIGKKRTPEQKKRISLALTGSKSSFWRGGVTPLHCKIRSSSEYKQWRIKVFERDNYTCQKCNTNGGYLQAHHIKEFSRYPELRFEISNGITLCLECHKETDNFGWKKIQ